MNATLRKVGIIIIGWLLVIVGLLLSIPGIPGPGLLIALIGLYVISKEQHWAHRLIERLYTRFPKLRETVDRAEAWFHRKFSRSGEQPGE